MPRRILFVEPPGGELEDLSRSFRSAAGPATEVVRVRSAGELDRQFEGPEPPDLVVVDFFLGDGERDGSEVLESLRRLDPDLPVVAVAERGDVD